MEENHWKKIIIGCSHVRLRGMLLWTTWCLNNSSGCLLMSPINTCIESPETIFIWNILIKLSTSGRLINNNVHNVQYFHGGAGHIFVNGFSIDWAGVGHIRTLKTRPAWSGVRRPRWRSSCPRPPPWRTSPGSPPASSSPPRPCPPPAGARWQVISGSHSARISAANRLIGEVVQSRRRPLLGPSPGWKRLLALSHLRHN